MSASTAEPAAPASASTTVPATAPVALPPARVLIHGARGRMGQALLAAAEGAGVQVAGGVDAGAAAAVGSGTGPADAASPGIAIGAGWPAAEGIDAVIDFTRPAGAMAALDWCVAHGKALVLGTTGLLPEELARVTIASRSIAICRAANFSLGVNLCALLLEQAAAALGDQFDIEIVEAHHRHKVDAPSGTALMLGEAVARGLGRGLEEGPGAVYAREGHTGARPPGTIGFSTIRGGDVVGEHTVMFLGEGERVEITHRATSRGNFALGALRASRWLVGRAPGLYSMRDVLA